MACLHISDFSAWDNKEVGNVFFFIFMNLKVQNWHFQFQYELRDSSSYSIGEIGCQHGPVLEESLGSLLGPRESFYCRPITWSCPTRRSDCQGKVQK